MIPELERIKELLRSEWDPIGVGHIPEAIDEYDSYAFHVWSRLKAGGTAEEVAAYLTWAVGDHIGLEPDPQRERKIADKAAAVTGL